jgi:hypothetical protein
MRFMHWSPFAALPRKRDAAVAALGKQSLQQDSLVLTL